MTRHAIGAWKPPLRLLTFLLVSGAAVITPASTGSAAPPARNGLIAFAHAAPPEQIWLIRSNGRGLRALRTGVVPSWEPEWSPDGRRLAFRGGRNDDLYMIRPDGSGRRRLTRDAAHETHAAWSPDGKKIAFARYRGGPSSIYAITVTGRKLRRLTTGAGNDDNQPSWSPDGSRIAFVRQSPRRGYEAEIWIMRANGSHERRLFTGASDPVWAPTGRRLLMSDDRRIYVMDLERGRPRAVVTLRTNASGETEEAAPEWSPDGTKIVFDQLNRQGGSDVWVVNADRGGLRRITPPSGPAHPNNFPSWQPRRAAGR